MGIQYHYKGYIIEKSNSIYRPCIDVYNLKSKLWHEVNLPNINAVKQAINKGTIAKHYKKPLRIEDYI